MEPKTVWRCLDDNLLIEMPHNSFIPEMKSYEKKNQTFRESIFDEVIYSSKDLIPDSPREPDVLELPDLEPFHIPIEDTIGSSKTFTIESWPEPKSDQSTLITNREGTPPLQLHLPPLNYDIEAVNGSHQNQPFQWHGPPPYFKTHSIPGNYHTRPFLLHRTTPNYEPQFNYRNYQTRPLQLHQPPSNHEAQLINRYHHTPPFQLHQPPSNHEAQLINRYHQTPPFHPYQPPYNNKSHLIYRTHQVPPSYYTHPHDARVYLTNSGQYNSQHESPTSEEEATIENPSRESTSKFYRGKIRNKHQKNCTPRYMPYRTTTE